MTETKRKPKFRVGQIVYVKAHHSYSRVNQAWDSSVVLHGGEYRALGEIRALTKREAGR